MKDGEKLATCFAAHKNLKSGTLNFFGVWFGRPMDNSHTVTSVSYEKKDDLLILRFNEDEMLRVWGSKGIHADSETFCITDAARVRWEWFYYGRPKVNKNILFYDFYKSGNAVTLTSNTDKPKAEQKPSTMEPAVKIH